MKSIPELKQEMAARQSKALTSIFHAANASAQIELDLTEREIESYTTEQMGRIWRDARDDAVKAATEVAKDEYLAAETAYAKAQAKRIEEIHEAAFGAARDLPASEVLALINADESSLDQLLTMALESGNDATARAILHTAWNRELSQILARWREEVDSGHDDLGMLDELSEAWDEDEILERSDPDRFYRLAATMQPSMAELAPRPGSPVLLKGSYPRYGSDGTV